MTVDLGPPAQAVTPEKDGSGQRTIGMIVGGAGVAGLVVGGIFGGLAIGSKSTAKSSCGPEPAFSYPTKCDINKQPDTDSANKAAKTQSTISTIGFIAGAALAAGGAVLYFTAPKGSQSTTAARRVYVTPAVGKNDAGFLLGGAF